MEWLFMLLEPFAVNASDRLRDKWAEKLASRSLHPARDKLTYIAEIPPQEDRPAMINCLQEIYSGIFADYMLSKLRYSLYFTLLPWVLIALITLILALFFISEGQLAFIIVISLAALIIFVNLLFYFKARNKISSVKDNVLFSGKTDEEIYSMLKETAKEYNSIVHDPGPK